MPQDGDNSYCNDESFNSFLAGIFLTTECIKNLDFFEQLSEFENKYSVSIISGSGDIQIPIYFDDNFMQMHADYDDIININGLEMTVRDYLYSLTSFRVRNFFNISLPQEREVRQSNVSFLRRLIMRRPSRRKCTI